MSREVEVEVIPRGAPLGPSRRRGMPPPEARMGCGLLFGLVLIAWGIEIADSVMRIFDFSLDRLGIFPREPRGLVGVFFSPWLHGGWAHLASNTIAFLGLGFVMSLAEGRRFLRTTLLLVIWSGLGTWLIGRGGTVHIGASGLIYGYFGYLLSRAWTDRHPLWIAAGVVVAILYGSMLWGVIPSHKGISWEAHLCGLIAGIYLGRSHGLSKPKREELLSL